MVSQEVIDTINYTKDLDFEFNLKLFLLLTTLIYGIVLIYLSFKWDKDTHYVKLIKNFLIRIPFGIYIFFFPLTSIYMLRGFSWEVVYSLVVVYYSYALVVLLISAKLGIFEFLAQLLGFKTSPKQMKLDSVKQKW